MSTQHSTPPEPTTPKLRVMRPLAEKKPPTASPKAEPKQESSDSPSTSPPQQPSAPQSSGSGVPRLIAISGVITLLVGASFIPVPNNVLAEGQLEPISSTPVFLPVSGTLKEFHIESKDNVRQGQKLLTVVTRELDEKIETMKRQLTEAKRELAQAEEQIEILKFNVLRSDMAVKSLANEAQRLNNRLDGRSPEITKLEQDQAAMRTRISAIQSELIEIESQANLVRGEIGNIERLIAKGGEGLLLDSQINEPVNELKALERQKHLKEGEIRELREQIAAKDAEIQAVKLNWQDEVSATRDRQRQTQAGVAETEQELNAARRNLLYRRDQVEKYQEELATLEAQQAEGQTILAPKQGTITTKDEELNAKLGRKMEPEELVLDIAQTHKFKVVMEVSEVDEPFVADDAKVTIRFRAGNQKETIRVTDKTAQQEDDETGQKKIHEVYGELKNPEGSDLKLGQTIYATINSEKVPLYRKIGLELRKLLNWDRYGVG